MEEQKCGNCRYYSPSCCRRNPPIGVGTFDGNYNDYKSISFGFPPVSNTDWCGEWQPKLTNLQTDAQKLALAVINNPGETTPIMMLLDELNNRVQEGER